MPRSDAPLPLRTVCTRGVALLALCLLVVLATRLASAPAQAHDLPGELLVRMFVKPEVQRLHVLIRVPLALLEGMALPKRGAGYLDFAQLDEPLERSAVAVARAFVLLDGGAPLTPERATWRISLPSEEAFGSFEQAQAHVLGEALPPSTNVFWNQGYFDVYYQYPLASAQPALALQSYAHGLSGILKLYVDYLPADGMPHAFALHADDRVLSLNPRWYHAALTFTKLGFDTLLQRIDYLIFLLCLALPFRREQIRRLIVTLAAFAAAHSITVLAAGGGVVTPGPWLPPVVELLIAVSIVYLAVENIVCAWLGEAARRQLDWRWLCAGSFGLVYGFAFSAALQDQLQLAGAQAGIAMLAFDMGLVIAQLAFLAIALPALWLLSRSRVAERAAVIIGSAFLAHTGWHWLLERLGDLRYVSWPDVQVHVALIGAILVLVLAPYLALRRNRAFVQRQERGAGSD